MADDALVIAAAMIGAPRVIMEKTPSGDELAAAVPEDVRRDALAPPAAAGADPGAVRVVLREEIPVACPPGNAARVLAKAAGPLVDCR